MREGEREGARKKEREGEREIEEEREGERERRTERGRMREGRTEREGYMPITCRPTVPSIKKDAAAVWSLHSH